MQVAATVSFHDPKRTTTMKSRICKYCDESFTPEINHPGLITVCLDPECQQRMAADGVVEPTRKTACVEWTGKHTVEITIVDSPEISAAFNASQRRFGAGPMMAISNGIAPRPRIDKRFAGEEKDPDNEIKEGTNKGFAEPGSLYFSRLGEAHSVKR